MISPDGETLVGRSFETSPPECRFALAVLVPEPGGPSGTGPRPDGLRAEAVVGSTDAHVIVDRVSTDIVTLLDHDPAEVVGNSLLRLIHPDDVASVLRSLFNSHQELVRLLRETDGSSAPR